MVTSRHTSPAILAAALIAGSVFLLQDSGFFDGAFRTDILASVKAGDSLSRSNVQALGGLATAQQIDRRKTGAVH
jgi:hypothetical protein